MKAEDIMVSCVSISEDDYDYRGTFILSCNCKNCSCPRMEIDLAAFESDNSILADVKTNFKVEDPLAVLRKAILAKVIEYSGLSSKEVQGENFNEETDGSSSSGSLDKA